VIFFFVIPLWAIAALGCFLLLASRRLRPLALPSGLAVGFSVPMGFAAFWAVSALLKVHPFAPGRGGAMLFVLALTMSFAVGAACGALGGAVAGTGLNRAFGLHLRQLPVIEPALRWWFGAAPVRWTARRG
jgi:hypothetical protein